MLSPFVTSTPAPPAARDPEDPAAGADPAGDADSEAEATPRSDEAGPG